MEAAHVSDHVEELAPWGALVEVVVRQAPGPHLVPGQIHSPSARDHGDRVELGEELGRASPDTLTRLIRGGLGRRPQARWNTSKAGWSGWSPTT